MHRCASMTSPARARRRIRGGAASRRATSARNLAVSHEVEALMQQKEARSPSSGARASPARDLPARARADAGDGRGHLPARRAQVGGGQVAVPHADGRVQRRRREVQQREENAGLPHAAAADARPGLVAGALRAPARASIRSSARPTRCSTSTASRCAPGQGRSGAGAVQAHLERASQVALPPRRVDGGRRGALLRRQRLQGRARRLRRGPQVPRLAALRPRALQDGVVLLEARRLRRGGAPLQGGARPRLGSCTAKSQARAHQLTEAGRKRLEELKGEALDYLVQVFTEDERKGPKDAFDFLASIGGAIYSRKVIAKLADTFYTQARYERAIESERFLIHLDPPTTRATPIGRSASSRRCARWTRTSRRSRSCASWPRPTAPGGDWAKAQQNPAGDRARAQGRRRHAPRSGQGAARRRAARRAAAEGHIDVERYAPRRRRLRLLPLATSATTPTPPRSHYLLGDIYFFKLKKYEEAGDAYLAVGKTQAGRQAAPRGAAAGDRRPTKSCARPFARRARRSSCRRTSAWARRSISTRRCSRRIRRSPTSSTRTASSSTTTASTTRP